jgi:hypothetical protein
VSDAAERGVMVEASPCSAFEVIEADLLLELLIVALDAPAKFGEPHERV